ncbi:MAG: DNA recombination protein RmuC, partial [Alphaproteobacteria bacterium]|nr:DNA recombination protein RmuC [Alphaproteobacteria bacterium]
MTDTLILAGVMGLGFLALTLILLKKNKSSADLVDSELLQQMEARAREAETRLYQSDMEIKKLETQLEFLEKQLSESNQKIESFENTVAQHRVAQNELREEAIRLESSLKEERSIYRERERLLEESLENQRVEQQKLQERMNLEFKNLAQSILDKNAKEMHDRSTKDIGTLLSPLREQLGNFSKLVQDSNEKAIERNQDLKNELSNMNKMAVQMSEEARDLTRSLKGQAKMRGAWGEMILERSLEMSGLRKGVEYTREESFKDEDGQQKRTDVIVHLPGGRSIIIDSKMSLVDYDRYVNSSEDHEKDQSLKAHIESVRNHIKGLAGKSYHDLPGINSPDFTIMFVPLESAL